MLAGKLLEYVLPEAGGKKILDVRAGLGYTGVVLEDGACGLAYTFRNELGFGCGILNDAGNLVGSNAAELLPWLMDSNRLKAAIGLAAVNAVINSQPGENWGTGDVVDELEVEESDTFGMVGDFKPILMKVREKTKDIYVFEKNPPLGSDLFPSETIPVHLTKCSVVIVTATSIINHTIDEVLPYCQDARVVCMVGASTPLCPEVFKDFNVTLLAGSLVQDPSKAMETISQGGGVKALKPVIRQVMVQV